MLEPIEAADYGCIKSEADQLAELMQAQEYADKQVLRRVSSGESTEADALYLCGRLGRNANILRK